MSYSQASEEAMESLEVMRDWDVVSTFEVAMRGAAAKGKAAAKRKKKGWIGMSNCSGLVDRGPNCG